MEECIFCAIAKGRMEADVIYSDETVVAFKDIDPQAPVHILVIPRRHIESALDLGPNEKELLYHIFEVINKVADSEGVASSGVRILTNVGKEAEQIVKHLHFHLLGGRKMLWPPG
jgi:histidine triad (HIT) family protein